MPPESKAARRKRERAAAGRLADSDFLSLENISPEEEVQIKADLSAPAPSPQLTALDGGGAKAPTKKTEPEPEPGPEAKPAPVEPADEAEPEAAEKLVELDQPLRFYRKPPLTVVTIRTTSEIWERYERLSLDMTEAGHPASASEAIRLVLGKELPDLETEAGKQEAYRLGVEWAEKRRAAERKVISIRMRVPMISAIRSLCREARRSGANIGPSQIISALLERSRLEARAVARLED